MIDDTWNQFPFTEARTYNGGVISYMKSKHKPSVIFPRPPYTSRISYAVIQDRSIVITV